MKRLYPDQPIIGVSAVIICNSRILLEKRKSEPGRGRWGLPGGLVELGESTDQTVIREVGEETNLSVEKSELVDIVDNIRMDEGGKIKYHFVTLVFGTILRNDPRDARAQDDAAELRWVPFEQVEECDLTSAFREFFQKNRHKLEKLDSCSKLKL